MGIPSRAGLKSWKSGNTKIVKVDKKGKITAQKKTGKAMITITLASGLEKQIKVTVQKSSVEAQKITGIPKTVTLRNGKMNPETECFTCNSQQQNRIQFFE